MSVDSFDVFKRMCAESRDIRLGVDILRADKVKAGSQVTIGIGGDVVNGIAAGDLNACLLVWSKAEFADVKRKLAAETP